MNVFLVLSPLQVLNALEAKAHFGTKDNVLVVLRHTSQGYPLEMFRRLVDVNDWDQAYFLSTYRDDVIAKVSKYRWAYLSLLQQWRLDRLATTLGSADGLFVGLYNEPLARHFSNVLLHNTLYLLDDGTDTLAINESRKGARALLGPTWSRMSLLSKLFRTRNQQAERAVFFTVYELETSENDRLIPNRYHYFRARMATVPQNDEVWFLGSPLELDGYVSRATYLHYLEHIHRSYPDRRFIYLPHSRERQRDVHEIGALLGCEVRRYGLPVEVALSRANPRPGELVSFITSALTSCHVMFGDSLRLTSVYLAPESVLKHRDAVRDIYRQFYGEADTNFRVVTLAQLAEQTATV